MSFMTLNTNEKGRQTPSQHRDPKTPLRLGDIVINLKDPAADFTVLNAEAPVSISGGNIRTTIQEDFYPKLRNPKEVKLLHSARIKGLEIQNIDGIPKSELKILETQVLSLSKGYLNTCMNLEPVKAWRESNDDCFLYLITGLKTIREPPSSPPIAEPTKLEEEKLGWVDSVPDQTRTGDQEQEYHFDHTSSSDYLLAYQVSRVRQTRKKKIMVDEKRNCLQRQVGPVERQQTSGEESPSFIASPPMWAIFRRAQS